MRMSGVAPVVASLAAVALAGCRTVDIKIPTAATVSSQDQAASVLVTATMEGPWDEVSASLNPKFTMSGDAAVSAVLPVTEHIQQENLSAIGVSATVGLPQSSTQSSNGVTQAASNGVSTTNGVTTTTTSANNGATSTSTTTNGPGVPPTAPTGIPTGATLPTASISAADLGVDPVLKYKAANYLNQEVQLLNQQVNHAADRDCFVPFVANLHLGLMTYRPHLAYSVHTRVAFLHSDADPPDTPPQSLALIAGKLDAAAKEVQAARRKGTLEDLDAASALLADARASARASMLDENCPNADHLPVVVPLLVADDIRIALKSHAAEVAQQLALALSYMAHGVGGSGSLNNVRQALTAISNQDLTSTLTVSAETDNTLYVHVEPNNAASGDPSLVGGTYDVWVLLLLPRAYFGAPAPRRAVDLDLVSYTQFRNAFDGKVLPSRPVAAFAAQADRVLVPYMNEDQQASWTQLEPLEKQKALKCLWTALSRGHYEEFQKIVAAEPSADCPPSDASSVLQFSRGYSAALWVALGGLIADNSYKTTHLQAAAPKPVGISRQTVLLSDDGNHPIQATLFNVGGQSGAKLAAHLELTPVEAIEPSPTRHGPPAPAIKRNGHAIQVAAQSVGLDAAAHTLTLTFPSLAKIGVSEIAADPLSRLVIQVVDCDVTIQLCPRLIPADADGAVSLPVYLQANKAAPPQTKLTLASVGTLIAVQKGGAGSLPVVLTGLPAGDAGALTLSGAGVGASADPLGKAVGLGKSGYVLPKDGAYSFSLINLAPGQTVTVSVQALKADGKTKDGDAASATYTAVPADLAPAK